MLKGTTVAGLALLLTACMLTSASARTPDPRGVSPLAPNPLRGEVMHRDTHSKAYWAVGGVEPKSGPLAKVFARPVFRWFGVWSRSQFGGADWAIRSYISRANKEQPGTVPQVAVLRHLGQHCSARYQAGGAAEDERTRQWYRDFARGVGDSRVVIGFEPDSLGTVDCLAKSRRRARLNVLRYGIDVLSQLPRATIYLEAGASDWEPAARTARMLRYVGVAKVRGFMLNATHYDWTANNIRYGLDISRRVGGKPFVISTAFNGRGPVHYRQRLKRGWRRVNVWCHPLKRGLGIAPTTVTHHPKVDAYLYIGRPGYSGGDCNGGPPTVGDWFRDRAVMLGRYATDWIAPPKGTRYGLYGRPSLKSVAGDEGPK